MRIIRNIYFRAFLYSFFFIIISLLVITIFLSSLGLSTFSNSLNPYLSSYTTITFPENFGFFTKSPKDKRIKFYSLIDKKVQEIDLRANSSNNLFGLKRNNRRLLYELGIILRKIPDSIWLEKESNEINQKMYPDSLFISIDKKKLDIIQIEKGEYLIYYYEPIPWELNKYQKSQKGEIAYINVY